MRGESKLVCSRHDLNVDLSEMCRNAGQVGYLVLNMKNAREARVGDTFHALDAIVDPLPGFEPCKSMVFAGLYPFDSSEFEKLSDAIERLTLNDASVFVHRETSHALGILHHTKSISFNPPSGQGFRLGFLGMLHLDVFRQRLRQEYQADVIVTAPSVPYRCLRLTRLDGDVD